MVDAATYSLDEFREKSLEYVVQSGIQPDHRGIQRVETPNGLEIVNAEGWLRITGTLVEFVPPDGAEVEIDYEVTFQYNPPRRPDITRERLGTGSRAGKKAVPQKDFNKVATELMQLLPDVDELAPAS